MCHAFSRPGGTLAGAGDDPALKRRAIVGLSRWDEGGRDAENGHRDGRAPQQSPSRAANGSLRWMNGGSARALACGCQRPRWQHRAGGKEFDEGVEPDSRGRLCSPAETVFGATPETATGTGALPSKVPAGRPMAVWGGRTGQRAVEFFLRERHNGGGVAERRDDNSPAIHGWVKCHQHKTSPGGTAEKFFRP
jgi:hypothetical protein